jgi:hypothetical protein
MYLISGKVHYKTLSVTLYGALPERQKSDKAKMAALCLAVASDNSMHKSIPNQPP